ncbi:MAG: precorrin-6A reductase [Lachnospiraceae bacterium]|nr:precorrin-6A reductase [Butyrivibrio sp.]MCM1344646.1 precorrin-6A reductase [Muribaculaceae bacterium]MCM1411208.1 precorrin-6A reductase [Lachnospiraceae bacterium]
MRGSMREILIFAGTTEGRVLSERLSEAEVPHTVCVATEYGEIVLGQHPLVKIHRGRMNQEEIEVFLKAGDFSAVVDATHPFAEEITRNIKAAVNRLNEGTGAAALSYFRLRRDSAAQGATDTAEDIAFFETNTACAKALEQTEGNLLLTTGSKELAEYCGFGEVRQRLYVRVLPGMESLSLCMEQGIRGKQIIAMQGPFSVEMNEAILRQYQISCLVTKESGVSGGYPEKLEAARRAGTRVFVIGRPREDEGCSFAEVCGRLAAVCGREIRARGRMEIILAGIGMGYGDSMTREVEKAVREADLVFGAERMLANLRTKAETYPFYQAGQIIPRLREVQDENPLTESSKVVVLFSGDSGFYSGCQALHAALEQEIRQGRLEASLRIMPGISSVAYLAACIGESYQDAAVYSMHGKKLPDLAHRIRNHPKTFLLTSGVGDVNRLGQLLTEADMGDCEVITGYQLSYEEQRVTVHTPAECCGLDEEGLYTCFIRNPHAADRRLTHGIPDPEFVRDRVPMTKEEVREVSICKMRLRDQAVVYDIGSGTGSIAVEIAGLSEDIRVYAVERKREAAALIGQNREKFGLQNITVVEAEAPEGLSGLPMATHAFIGGSGGRLEEILAALRRINPRMRVVLNAVSMETISEIRKILSMEEIAGAEVAQLQVNRAKKIGDYHMMQAENPVWICAFDFTGEGC